MSLTPPLVANDDTLNESWVELYYGASSSDRATPPLSGNAHILEKLLLEAQRESNASSAKGSGSPKSPHSPCSEPLTFTLNKEEKQIPTDWIWDWSSRPDQQPPKDWKFRHPSNGNRRRPVLSLRGSRIIRLADIFPALLLSNLLSVLLGAGIGVCIGRRMKVANVD
ncbi:BCL2/adenovirus E1B 19 kDa protein-interacting protein 3-like [Ornithodoros turicata]|uniref:Putative conserved plasma membrane protein n=1 Tax=Ornithodoros turicata TaxID=34597 RepID=A0A2R5L4Y9_9ACAR